MIVDGICVYEKDKGTAEVASTQQVITVQERSDWARSHSMFAGFVWCSLFCMQSLLVPVVLFACVAAGCCGILQSALSFSPALAVLKGVSVGVSGILLPPLCLLCCCSVSSAEPWCLCWSCKPLSSLLFYKPQGFSLLPLSMGTFLWGFLLFWSSSLSVYWILCLLHQTDQVSSSILVSTWVLKRSLWYKLYGSFPQNIQTNVEGTHPVPVSDSFEDLYFI